MLIPFCDWRLEMPDILWCEPHEAPFDALPIVPIDYSEKQMMGTIYEDDYKDEHLQNTVDNLNLSLNQYKSLDRVAMQAARLGMEQPGEGQIRVVSLPVTVQNTSTQSAENIGAEGMQ